ncbi:MAG TPA: DUF998 domain-containing protein [Actinomycetes bacterium]|nr:DUF998 domain-containing protein [Actinomycetes bacterium]
MAGRLRATRLLGKEEPHDGSPNPSRTSAHRLPTSIRAGSDHIHGGAAPVPELQGRGGPALARRHRDPDGIHHRRSAVPGVYTTHTNTVSHLGASEPPNSVVLQPSAAIFDITMLVAGAMILAGAWFAYRALGRRGVLIPTALLGVGTLGVGVFPLTHPVPHTLFAFTAFVAGGIAVVLSSRGTTAPFRSLWTTLGAIALGATVLALDAFRTWTPMVELGEGGLERWIVYPIVLWLVAFGSYLLAIANPTDTRNPAGTGG